MSSQLIRRVVVTSLTAVALMTAGAAPPSAAPGVRAAAFAAQAAPSSTVLPDGRLLLVGGTDADGRPSRAVRILDPQSGAETRIPAELRVARAGHTATAMPDGSILILGGVGRDGQIVTTVEAFDPVTGGISDVPVPPVDPRAYHTATVTTDGKLVIAGGFSAAGQMMRRVEIWDPTGAEAVRRFALSSPRAGHHAALLADGRIELSDGRDASGSAADTRQQIDPIAMSAVEMARADAVQAVTSLRVVGSTPGDGAQDVALRPTIAVRFSILTAAAGVNSATITLSNGDGIVEAAVHSAEGGRLAFLVPARPLDPDGAYTIAVAGVSGMAGEWSAVFTTAGDRDDEGEHWTPGPGGGSDAWRIGGAPSPWQGLRPLDAGPGVTALAGQALKLTGEPLRHVTLSIGDRKTLTDATGRFLLPGVAAGHQELLIDGESANHGRTAYGVYEAGVDLVEGKTTALTYTIWMSALDMAHAVTIPSPTRAETVVSTPVLPGLEFRIPAGTVIQDHRGKAVRRISITPIPLDRPPFPLPTGVVVPIYFTIQPGAGYLVVDAASPQKGGRLFYPNSFHQRPGTRFQFWNYEPDGEGWFVYGRGTVSADARQIVPDPGVEIYELTGAMVADPFFASYYYAPLGNVPTTDGDPVDLSSGLMTYSKTDLALPGPIPIALTRTYRQLDFIQRAFGPGTSHDFEMFLIGDASTPPMPGSYSYTDLVLANGTRVHFVRTSAGYGYTDAVFKHSGTSTMWNGAEIRWNGNGWNLTTRDLVVYTFPDSELATTAAQAGVKRIVDRFGNTVSINRGTNGRVTAIYNGPGRYISFSYDASDRVIQAQDNIGRIVTYSYDPVTGMLAQVIDAAGGITKYSYDEFNELTVVQDARGITYLTNQYGAGGVITQQTLADGTTYKFAYTACGTGCRQTTVTDPRGMKRRVTFDAAGYTVSDVRALGRPEQQTTTYGWSTPGHLLESVTNPLGQQTTFTYDSKGNVLTATRLAGTPAAASTTTFTYDALRNNVVTVTDALNHTTAFTYGGAGVLETITDSEAHTTSFTNSTSGLPVTMSNALGHTASFSYDEGADLGSVTDPRGGGATATLFHDAVGRVRSVTNALNQRMLYEYDALNQVSTVTDPRGGSTAFTYDTNGNLLTVTDASSHTTSYAYDLQDRLVRRTDPLGRIDTYAYDAMGNLTTATDRRGAVTTMSYDGLNRPVTASVVVPWDTGLNRSITYTYDALDRLTQAVDSLSGTITRAYNDVARTVTETSPQGSVTWTADKGGRTTSMQVAGQPAVTYTYDNADRLTTVTQNGACVSFTYDAANRRTSKTLPNGIVATYTYDEASLLTGITYAQGATVLGTLTYGHDLLGRRTNVGGSWARTTLPSPVTAAYDAANQLSRFGTAPVSYDAAGQLTTDGTHFYEWDGRRQLTSIDGGATGSFVYDGFGRRTQTTLGGTTTRYLYAGANAVQEQTSTGTPTANLLTGGVDEIFTRTDTAGTLHPLGDVQGSTIATSDGNGAIGTTYTYGAFGQTTQSAAGGIRAQYTGRENDGTGLYYYRARYYAPALQRFISEDPLEFGGGDVNLYGYVGNDPVSYVDPYGESFWVRSVRLLAEGGRGFTKVLGGKVSIQRAIEIRKAGGNIESSAERISAQIERAARKGDPEAGRILHHGPEKDRFGYLPHYQTDGRRGHSFYHGVGAAIAPFSMSMAGRKDDVDMTTILSAALWDLTQWLDPIFLTDAINWWFDLDS